MTWEQPLARSLRGPRYLISWWPWRSLAYLATTVPIAGVLSPGPHLRGRRWWPSSTGAAAGPTTRATVVGFLVLAGLLVVALAPLVSRVVAPIERRRWPWWTRVRCRHRAARGYFTAPTWREVAYTVWLSSVVPLAYALLALIALLDATLVASPWLAGDADTVIVIWTTVDTPGQALPYALLGVAFIPVLFTWSGSSSRSRTRWPAGCSAPRSTARPCAR